MNTQTTHTPRLALILGATGGIGGTLARELRSRGWQLRALNRRAAEQPAQPGLQWVQGDAMNAAEVRAAAEGAQLIVHAVNPPGYRRWAELVLPMLSHSIAAARDSGARLLLPGTVYNFGPDAYVHPHEDAPQHPLTRKGAIRVQMEQALQQAAENGVRSLLVRAGDYFGPEAANNWFSQCLVQPGRVPSVLRYPGREGVGHQWAYLPDVARSMAALLEREAELPALARFHMQGHWDFDGRQMMLSIARVLERAGARAPRLGRFPWWLATLAAPLVPTFNELREMRYLWEQPLRMDNGRLCALLGQEPHTPLDDAVQATLASLGCLPTPAPVARAEEARLG